MGQPQYEFIDEEQMQRDIIEEVKLLDSKTLRLIHSMMQMHAVERTMDENPVVDHSEDGIPVRAKEFVAEMDSIVEDVRNGNYVTVEEMRNRKMIWEKDTE